MTQTVTHEVEIDGEVAYSTQRPVGMDPDVYDSLVRKIDESVRTEASAGRLGAEARFELAVSLKLNCPELADKTWRQLVQEPAYADAVTHINAKYGKAKSAYSNHLTELREDKHQLDKFFRERFPELDDEERNAQANEWWLDPKREKTGGGRRKTHVVQTTSSGEKIALEVSEPTEDEDADESSDTLVGLMSAAEARLNGVTESDWATAGAEFLNNLNQLIRAAERAKSMYIQHVRSSGS